MNDVPGQQGERSQGMSRAGYLGAAAGLVVGVILVELAAAALVGLAGTQVAEMVWEVGSPLAGLLGAIAGAFVFQRLFRGQFLAPLAALLIVLLLASMTAFLWVGFPWVD